MHDPHEIPEGYVRSYKLRVDEIFGPTIQGEGVLIGQPTVFVRLGGCDYRCSWCDSLHAVDSEYRFQWKQMKAEEIMAEVEKLSGGKPLIISISGGNPALQNCSELIALGKEKGYSFALETQGTYGKEWFKDLDTLTVSPKPPSSEMETDWRKLNKSLSFAGENTQVVLKVVIMDEADYNFAKNEVAKRYPNIPLYLQPGNHTPLQTDAEDGYIDMDGITDRMRWMVDKIVEDGWYAPIILPQLHVFIWGNKRGV